MKFFSLMLVISVLFLPLCGSAAETVRTTEHSDGEKSENFRRAMLLVRTMEMLRKNYVDSQKVSDDKLFEYAIRGMTSALDPYSGYETPKRYSEERVRRIGTVVGIGAVVSRTAATGIRIVQVMPGSPAEKKGLNAGDIITHIDGRPIRHLNLASAVELLRGNIGTSVKLQYMRRNRKLETTIMRDRVLAPTIPPEAVKLIPGTGIGYIPLRTFSMKTPEEFIFALQKIKKLNAAGLIIDLRNNPGGIVQSAVEVFSILCGPGKVVFKSRSRDKKPEKEVVSFRTSTCDKNIPLAVLVNANTASSSEILTGALRDHKRSVAVVGMRTYGKGTILNVTKLPNGGAVRYAAAHYVTPGGRVIEGKGIIPDREVQLSPLELRRITRQSVKYPGEVRPLAAGSVTDRQLKTALELLLRQIRRTH